MNLCRLVKLISFITLVALIYTNLQMQIIDLAYQGKLKEKRIITLREDNSVVSSSILELKSASYLGIKLLVEGSPLQFRDSDNTKKIITSMNLNEDESSIINDTKKRPKTLLSFISQKLATEAQAHTMKRKDSTLPWRRKGPRD